ncbi:MAG: Uma2 family endonuclease [Gammaproteobacteria bacterium]|nr:Uma2 family endonuclease [Gammaproteobacteria bacterium]
MNNTAEQLGFTPEDYLAWEAEQAVKHEYLRGEVFAMTGVSIAHNKVNLNLALALKQRLRGGPCEVLMAEVKLQVEAADAFFYPDLMVTCAAEAKQDSHTVSRALLVAEILSPSTEAYNRGEKFASYRKLPSLQEYLLIDPDRLSVELFRRDASNHWVLYTFALEDQLELASLDLRIPVSELFEDLLPG